MNRAGGTSCAAPAPKWKVPSGVTTPASPPVPVNRPVAPQVREEDEVMEVEAIEEPEESPPRADTRQPAQAAARPDEPDRNSVQRGDAPPRRKKKRKKRREDDGSDRSGRPTTN